jgi:signal transduction histidine kinase
VRLEASLRASEERLESQVAELQELHKVKGDFVATISHELRTPLTSILGKVELLEEGDYGEVTDDQAQALEVIDRNSHRLLVLIEDLLTVARIESARLQLRVAPTSLLPFVEGIAELVQPTAAARSVALQVDAGPGLGEAQIDALQFERALTNLLTNAVKFTPPGGCVTFCARRTDETVVFVVSDNGIGIPLEEQDRLFTRFFRSSLATELAVQGSGLGLVIAKNIVEEHGGTIAVVSAPREGTTVTVSLPVPA